MVTNLIEVNIDPKLIEEQIVKAVIEGSLGQRIKKVVDEKVKSLGSGWGEDALTRAINSVVDSIVVETVGKEYREKIAEAVRTKFNDEIVSKIVAKALSKFD